MLSHLSIVQSLGQRDVYELIMLQAIVIFAKQCACVLGKMLWRNGI